MGFDLRVQGWRFRFQRSGFPDEVKVFDGLVGFHETWLKRHFRLQRPWQELCGFGTALFVRAV